ncbi:MAG: diguanylate cyclase (GGDEF)-like protein [Myxococcota bacterium]|jgi:diguanylate cyclase (GGDEF)-like protein
MEQDIFGISHDKVGLMLARTWELPASLAMPLSCHHSLDAAGLPAQYRKACALAAGADWMAAVFSCDDKGTALARSRTNIQEMLGLDSATLDELLEKLPSQVEKAAEALGLRVKVQPRLEEIMRQANRTLVEENLSYQELTRALENSLAEQERLAVKLKEANERLEGMAYVDPLTNLVNRRRFHEIFTAELARHSRNGMPLSVVMIDLDKFKNINDSYGHPFGDEVLKAVAEALNTTLRATDIKARIGGEEMILVLPETDEQQGQLSTERVRVAIESLDLRTPTGRVSVTSSFGGVTWRGSLRTREEIDRVGARMMARADAGLYQAKNSGRNRACWVDWSEE